MIRIAVPVLAICACLASANGASAQVPTDTAGIVGSLVSQFDSLQIRSVAPAPYPREPRDRGALLSWVAKVAAAAELDVAEPNIPMCPWGRDPLPADAGYMLRLSIPVIDGTRAEIDVARECDNPEGYVHDVYGVGETYHFECLDGEWRLTSVERRWVT